MLNYQRAYSLPQVMLLATNTNSQGSGLLKQHLVTWSLGHLVTPHVLAPLSEPSSCFSHHIVLASYAMNMPKYLCIL